MPTALITGASKGIGQAAAKVFANAGWDLLLVARSELLLKELTSELSDTGRRVFFQPIDFENPELISSGFKQLLDKGLCPSVLINNAGAAWTGDLLSMPLKSWQWLVQMNLSSVFQVCSEVVPLMRSNGGLVINVSSHAAQNSFPQWGAYCTTKAALASFTKCLAEEERIHSIRACTLTLGSVNSTLWDTPTVQSSFDRNAMLSVDQVANTLLYLANQPENQIIEDLVLMSSTGAF